MNRIARFSGAAFGMVLLAGLAYYQGHSELATGEEDSLVGTVLPGDAEEVECDPSKTPEDPDFEDCQQVSQE